jgi:hypothetical protein
MYIQVFGGSDGNTQTDIFRDTKHLITSVIDGYNVCIFAYGQTGAGNILLPLGSHDTMLVPLRLHQKYGFG